MMERRERAFFKKRLISVLLATSLLSACAAAVTRVDRTLSQQKITLEAPSDAVTEGGIFVATVQANEDIKDATGLFQGHVVDFYPDAAPGASGGFTRYSALVGVEYGTTPGPVELVVKLKVGDQLAERKAAVTVKAGVFPSEKLHVPPKTVFPSARDMKQIARDRVMLARAYATKTLNRYWDPPAVLPIESEVTSVFGSSRVYNGKKQNVHLGTDLRAPIGTPIVAPMSGLVAVAHSLFYTGYTVILDHGYGLFTIYGHMSKLKVKEGDAVKKGQALGLSGMTGRASGPHLHWGVNLHGTKIDPMVLVQALGPRKPM